MAVADGDLITVGIDQCYLSELLTDADSSEPTYGTPIRVPGIQSLDIDPEFINVKLKGDQKVQDVYSKFESLKISCAHARLSLPALAVMLGSSTTSSGTTPDTQYKLTLKGADRPKYFKLEFLILYLGGEDAGGGGDYHDVFYKVKLTSFKIGKKNDTHAEISFEAEAIPLNGNDKCWEPIENETTVAISTSADTTAPTVSTSTPTDGATGVSVSANLTVTFSENVTLNSVLDEANVILMTAAGVSVPRTLTYNSGTFVLTINPDSNLSGATAYILVIGKGIQDPSGNHLADEYIVNLTTA